MMNRREAIKQVTAMLGGVVFVRSGDLLTAVEHAHARVTASRKQIGTFTAQDVALLDEVADTILPETKTPGAKAAKVGSFMAVMVTDTYDDQQQAIFRDGMRKLNDAGFMTKSPAERLAFLAPPGRGQKADMDTPTPEAPAHYV